MKKLIFIILLLALPVSMQATIVPLDASFYSGGVLAVPDSFRITVMGNHDSVDVYSSPGDTTITTAFFSDTLNRDYSAYSTLSLRWKVTFASGDSTIVMEDLSYRLTQNVNVVSDSYTPDVNVASVNTSAIEDVDIATISTNAIQISGSAESADSLQDILTGTGRTFNLSQFVVRAVEATDTAFLIMGATNAPAAAFIGADTATNRYNHGIYALGGSYGSGMFLRGGDNVAIGGAGMYLWGGQASPGLYALGGPSNGDGFYIERVGTGNDIELAGDGLISGTIDSVDKVPSNIMDSLQSQDDWIAHQTTSDSIMDSVGNLTVSAAIPESDMREIAGYSKDSVWHANFEANDGTAGSFGDTAKTWGATAATGLDSGVIYGAVSQAIDDSGLSYNRKFQDIDVEYAYAITADTFLNLPTDSAATSGGSLSDSLSGLHPATWYFDAPWGPNAGIDSIADTTPGWKYWMVWSAWNTEYTCIGASNDKITWEIPYYIDSSGAIVEAANPLSGHAKMSDPFLWYKSDTLFMIDREATGLKRLMYRYSVNGVNWSDTVHLWLLRDCESFSIVDEDTAYACYYTETTNWNLVRLLMTDWRDTTTLLREDTCNVVQRNGGTMTQKNSEVDKIADNKYLILYTEGTTRGVFLGESNNGMRFVLNNEPVIVSGVPPNFDSRGLYKSAMQSLVNGDDEIYLDVYYSGLDAATSDWHVGKSEIRFDGKHRTLQMANDIVYNGSFDGEYTTGGGEDCYIPDGWTLFDEGIGTYDPTIGVYEYSSSHRGRVFGMGRYNAIADLPDTAMVYQHVGKLVAGTYLLSGYIENDVDSICAVGIAIDDDTLLTGFLDSIFLTTDTSGYFYIATELSAGHHYVKLWVSGDAPLGCIFDDIRLEKIASSGTSGSGAADVTHYVRDTANSVMISGVKMDINTLAGTNWANVTTGSGGYGIYNANDNDTLVVTCFEPGYVFTVDTVIIASTSHTDTTNGCAITITGPSAANTCRCYMWAYDGSGQPQEGRVPFAEIIGRVVEDTCNNPNTPITDKSFTGTATDATGRGYVDVIWTSCLKGSSKTKFGWDSPSGIEWKHTDSVPSDTTWNVTSE
jgi:hypothetical protein